MTNFVFILKKKYFSKQMFYLCFILWIGTKIWAYKGYELLPQYPIDMRKQKIFPKYVMSATNKNGKIYIIRVKEFKLI